MKKLGIWLMAAFITLGSIGSSYARLQEPPEKKNKVTHNKATQNKVTKKSSEGVKKGAYGTTHNKATKKTNVNEGNKKYD